MNTNVFIFDPTQQDKLSAVRGIGRYMETLKELFIDVTFTGKLSSVPADSTLLNPYYDFLRPPFSYRKIAQRQITVIHDLIPLKYSRKFPAGLRGNLNIVINSYLLKSYDAIITDSLVTQQDICDLLHINKSKVFVAYPPLSTSFRNCVSQTHDRTVLTSLKIPTEGYCVYVGDATWNKNLVNLAQAIKIANLPCVFVGKVFEKKMGANLNHPWMDELREFLRITRGDKRFIFPGYVTNDQLVSIYKHAKLNILVSRDEGFGYSFAEAAACATPSVLADTPIFHETAQDAAVFANPEDPTNIAAAISNLFNSPTTRRTLGILARQRSGFFSPETFKQTVSSLLYNEDNP